MTDRENTPTRPDPPEELVAGLLRRAGPRPQAPDDVRLRVRAATRAAWRARLDERRRARRRRIAWAAAAAAALVAALWFVLPPGTPEPAAFARAEIVRGAATAGRAAGAGRPLEAGDALTVGEVVHTVGDARVALRTVAGHSLRLGADSRLRVVSATELALSEGIAYVDAGPPGEASAPLTVTTPFGAVEHLGTQYEVRLTEGSLRVRVREGRVRIEREGEAFEAVQGTSWTVDRAGRVVRQPTPVLGESWDWVVGVAPAPSIDGRPLGEFLQWVARETGWTVVWADPAVAARAKDVVLTGSIEGLTPAEALEAVLPTCDLTHRIDGARLVLASTLAGR